MPHNSTFVITKHDRLWRVDGQEGHVLIATSIDGGEAEQSKFYISFEDIRPDRLEPPSPDIVGRPSAQDVLLRALPPQPAPRYSPPDLSAAQPRHPQGLPVAAGGDGSRDHRVRMFIADDVELGKTGQDD